MKHLFILLLSCLLINCTAEPASDAATTPPPATAPAESDASPQPTALIMAELLPTEEAAAILDCIETPSLRQDDREYSTSATYSCTNPFALLSVSLAWKKDGTAQDVSNRDNNPALEKITSIMGADAAHLMAAQGRLMVAKGTYLLTVQLPDADAPTLSAVAEKILAQL
jgi:hypothetical protein